MIDKIDILRNYHDQAIVITLANEKEVLSGMIVDDTPDDHCVFVENPHLVEFYETRKKSLMHRVYFKDMKAIDYQ
ncbi:MAG: hypothetical protein P1P86_14760 [Bacteroidales bacterium]|nr:hypothetical protein [Bacteroidales bacterium]